MYAFSSEQSTNWEISAIIGTMRKKAWTFLIVLLLPLSLFAEAYGFSRILDSSLYSPAYAGRFTDALVNPASLGMMENDSVFYVNVLFGEQWDLGTIRSGEKLSCIQNLKSEITFSFISRHLSLTASSSTFFADRRYIEGNPVYDIYNALGIQIDWSYAFPYVSLGVRIKGGNALIREDKTVTGFVSAIENAYFSRFDSVSGHDYFSVGASIRAEVSFFSASFMIGEIVNLDTSDTEVSGNLHIGWDNVLDSMNFSFALRYPEFTRRGDLNLLRPRISFFWQGNPVDRLEIGMNLELQFQLLPSLDMFISVGYREYDHSLFRYDLANGVLCTALEIDADMFACKLIMNVDTDTFDTLYPSISISINR